jgi:hypothetical protein
MTDQVAVVAEMPEETLVAQAAKRPSFKRVKPEDQPKDTKVVKAAPKAEPKPVKKVEPAVVVAPVVQVEARPSQMADITGLIEIKNYLAGLINGNFTTEKFKMKELQQILILIDRKTIDLILGDEFKEFVNFKEADNATKVAALINNIKTGRPDLYR